mgnify:CR=1 FL=1
MKIYITAAQALSAHDTFLKNEAPAQVETFGSIMKFRAPDYKKYFDPLQRRRMSNLVKASGVCSTECVNEAGIEKPDAIIVATSLGNVEESEKFLNKMIDENVEFLTPTNFIQSNHNSLGAQIALNYRCNGYNVVYSHKTASFESALLDAFMQISEGQAQNVLVGGIDEITPENCELKKNLGLWKQEPWSNLDMLKSESPGSVPGEGVSFFMLSSQKNEGLNIRLTGISMFPFSDKPEEVSEKISRFLSQNGKKPHEIDLVLTGNNGDQVYDNFTKEVLTSTFPGSVHASYKHLCGQFDTAAGFGLWVATRILKTGTIPDHLRMNRIERNLNTVLLYHHDNCRNHSMVLIEKV